MGCMLDWGDAEEGKECEFLRISVLPFREEDSESSQAHRYKHRQLEVAMAS